MTLGRTTTRALITGAVLLAMTLAGCTAASTTTTAVVSTGPSRPPACQTAIDNLKSASKQASQDSSAFTDALDTALAQTFTQRDWSILAAPATDEASSNATLSAAYRALAAVTTPDYESAATAAADALDRLDFELGRIPAAVAGPMAGQGAAIDVVNDAITPASSAIEAASSLASSEDICS